MRKIATIRIIGAIVDKVVVNIETVGMTRASEIISDLRNATESIYFPMKIVGFWDHQADMHLCPQEERRQECPHKLPASDPNHVDYATALQRERQANLEVYYPHAKLALYLS